MIVLITSSPAEEAGAHIWPAIEREQTIDQINLSNSIFLSYDDLANLTTENRLVVPWFDNNGARDVFPKMEQRHRLAQDDGWFKGKHDARWDFTGYGPHSDLSNSEREDHHWRVFMTRSVDQFEINEEKEFRRFVDPEELYEEGDDLVRSDGEIRFSAEHPTVTFRYVTMNDNTRTLISTMLPEAGFVYCKGYIHAVEHEPGTSAEEQFALLAYFNSFTCDWWLRRIVDRHMNAPMINNLPIPDWGDNEIKEAAEMAAELTRRGGTETLPGGRPVPSKTDYNSVNEEEIRARIEALVAKGYDLDQEEVNTVLSDFTENAASENLRSRIQKLVSGDTMEAASLVEDDD